jgi:hypothetical protein
LAFAGVLWLNFAPAQLTPTFAGTTVWQLTQSAVPLNWLKCAYGLWLPEGTSAAAAGIAAEWQLMQLAGVGE